MECPPKAEEVLQPAAIQAKDDDAASATSTSKLDLDTFEIHGLIKRSIARDTLLPDSVSVLLAIWALSTWFPDVFIVLPCLVITGPAHEATNILRVLNRFCYEPRLLAGFRRADFKEHNYPSTLLISEPNLDARGAGLLGNLTNQDFGLIEQGSFINRGSFMAVYVGEDAPIKRIQHSIYIDATVPARALSLAPSGSIVTIAAIRNLLLEYRDKNRYKLFPWNFNPCGLSRESTAIAKTLGNCLVDAPQLQLELVALLRPRDQQQIDDRSDSDEALVLNAALALCHQGKDEVYAKEIYDEVKRTLLARGETKKFSPEKVGHRLKKVGMFTRTLSGAGRGLYLNQATKIRLHEVAAAYCGEGSIQEGANPDCPLCHKNEPLKEVN